jgi:quinolinate synthase
MKAENKLVQFMSHVICECSTMARIDPQHLAWCLENIVNNEPVNIIKVPEAEARLAKLALDRMLQAS